jgi:hypothetical protein
VESGQSDKGVLIGILIFGIICVGLYVSTWYPDIRGPATDLTTTIKIDSNGNISKYSVELHFVDPHSYAQFLQEMSSPDKKTIREYLFHRISSPENFKVLNDSANNRLLITSQAPFDPNLVLHVT